MIIVMFFGDVIIKEYFLVSMEYERGINNEIEQELLIFFVLFLAFEGWFIRQGVKMSWEVKGKKSEFSKVFFKFIYLQYYRLGFLVSFVGLDDVILFVKVLVL